MKLAACIDRTEVETLKRCVVHKNYIKKNRV